MSFADRSTEEQASLLETLARAALRAWSLDDAATALIKYRENAVFAVTAPGGERFVLRVHRPRYRTDDEIRSEAQWMSALGEAGVHTPAFVPAAGGDVVTHARAPGVPEPRQCDLLRWVDGSPLGTLEGGVAGSPDAVAETYAAVGELAARVHEHAAHWPRPEGFTRPAWDSDSLVGDEPTFGRFEELDCLSTDQLRVLCEARDRAREELDAIGRTPDRYGLIHGDFLPENILVGATGPQLIDFDDCGESWYAFELATGVAPLLGQPGFEAVCRAYVDGYQRVRKFPDEALGTLPALLVARSLSYLGWPVGRPEMAEGRALAPILAAVATQLAARYLAGEPLHAG